MVARADRPPAPKRRAEERVEGRRLRPRRRMSPLTWRILAVNVLALAILVGGLLYLGVYRDNLVAAKIAFLTTQGMLVAGALGANAVESTAGGEPEVVEFSLELFRRIADPLDARVLLFGADGALKSDSRRLIGAGRTVEMAPLPPIPEDPVSDPANRVYNWVVGRLPSQPRLPDYREADTPAAADRPEVRAALAGERASALWLFERRMLISVALPVQGYKRVLGAVQLQADTRDIEASMR